MKRYIEDMELVRQTGKFYGNDSNMLVLVLEMVNKTPSADVVEVVRCKDCRYRDEMCMCSHPKQEGILPLTYPLDFCSDGKRKEEKHV